MVQYSKNITRSYEFPRFGELNMHAHYYPCSIYQVIFLCVSVALRSRKIWCWGWGYVNKDCTIVGNVNNAWVSISMALSTCTSLVSRCLPVYELVRLCSFLQSCSLDFTWAACCFVDLCRNCFRENTFDNAHACLYFKFKKFSAMLNLG